MSVVSIKSNPARKRVLVVDDDLDTVHTMATLIKMMGHQVQFAINGFAALDIAREFRPEVVLLDISLPDFRGYDIARQLKWEPGLEGTRVVAISARPETDGAQAIAAGCEAFYRKPLDPRLLEQLIQNPLPGEGDAAGAAA
jgi:CheY-like chemotaxis protein